MNPIPPPYEGEAEMALNAHAYYHHLHWRAAIMIEELLAAGREGMTLQSVFQKHWSYVANGTFHLRSLRKAMMEAHLLREVRSRSGTTLFATSALVYTERVRLLKCIGVLQTKSAEDEDRADETTRTYAALRKLEAVDV